MQQNTQVYVNNQVIVKVHHNFFTDIASITPKFLPWPQTTLHFLGKNEAWLDLDNQILDSFSAVKGGTYISYQRNNLIQLLTNMNSNLIKLSNDHFFKMANFDLKYTSERQIFLTNKSFSPKVWNLYYLIIYKSQLRVGVI